MVQEYLDRARRFYQPTNQGAEQRIKERLERWRALIEQERTDKEP